MLLGCSISCCHPKNISKIGIFRSFSMKFFFSSKQECMTDTIQSIFLSETHVFVSISRLFQKNRVFYTPKMAQKFVFPESELEKFFHDSKMRAIDSPIRKTLVRSKISLKIDFSNQISTF